MSGGPGPVGAWLAELAWSPRLGLRRDVLIEADGGPIHRRDPGAAGRRAAGAAPVRLPGLTMPGLANAHSHAFHRALRGITQASRGTFWTWRERMYEVAARLDPDSYLALATGGLRRDDAGRDQLRRRVSLPAPRAGRRAVRRSQRDGPGAAAGRRRGRSAHQPAGHLLPGWRPQPGRQAAGAGRSAAALRRRGRRPLGRAGWRRSRRSADPARAGSAPRSIPSAPSRRTRWRR